MMANRKGEGKAQFKHESIQDRESIVEYLTAITEGLAGGSLSLSSDSGEIVLQPSGLLRLRVQARRGTYRTGLVIKVSWRDDQPDDEKDGALHIAPAKA
jgi:amphi-Trp domain-containing protein